jgi:hypothetical protein
VSEDSYPFSTMSRARRPLELSDHGYIEEEYLLSGTARLFADATADSPVGPTGEALPYTTRVLVRRPVEAPTAPTAWVSILNASQGYDIEDDWRRAWDVIIGRGDTYVGVTAKPINADALQNVDPERYAGLSWGGPLPHLRAAPGWNPFQVLAGSQEGLAWEILAQTAQWIRSGTHLPRPAELVMTGQSQSGIYTNTYLTHFHELLRGEQGEALFDGYLPGVASVLTRTVGQPAPGPDTAFAPRLEEPAQIDAPVIAITTDGDSRLFSDGLHTDAELLRTGDGPLRRHWHVAGAPHSDPRSRVIPDNAEILKARRLPRTVDAPFLEALNVLPLEPVTSAAMEAIVRWIRHGEAAAPTQWFAVAEDDPRRLAEDAHGGRLGGIRLGLLEHPLAVFRGAAAGNPVFGSLTLLPREEVLARYASFEDYRAACDAVDDRLEETGYLEPHGRGLLHAVQRELWDRVVDGAAPLPVTPQDPDLAPQRAAAGR